MKQVQTPNAPTAMGPYSQGIISGGFVFCAGQTPMDPLTGELCEGGIEEQTEQVMKNISAVLGEAGSHPGKIVKTTIFLKDFNDFEKVNAVYGSFLGDVKPARTTIEVSRLPKDALVEIECIAMM
jgi:2-iminobutanoate/2-iminopropanoate deaminase